MAAKGILAISDTFHPMMNDHTGNYPLSNATRICELLQVSVKAEQRKRKRYGIHNKDY